MGKNKTTTVTVKRIALAFGASVVLTTSAAAVELACPRFMYQPV